MSYRKKIKTNAKYVVNMFSNWLAQLASMLMTQKFYLISGRGSSKTTEFQVERLMEICYDMPGAPLVWVADTYSNLRQNVLPSLLEGLERKGWVEGTHYVVERKPPEHTPEEVKNLPKWLRPHFWKPFNRLASYTHTIVFFTGTNITFGSLDRPSTLAGRSYVHIFGDEVKFFKESKIAQLTKAVRGYRAQYGHSPFYRGHTFTTDMPDTRNVGEYDWITKQVQKMKPKAIMLLLKASMILNEVTQEWVRAVESKDRAEALKKEKLVKLWRQKVYTARKHQDAQTFFWVASSYINVDILTPEYFKDEFETDLSDINTAILSMHPSLEAGDRFYSALAPIHFYDDGNDPLYTDVFGLRDKEDCRILKHLRKDKILECGVDFGNQNSMVFGQLQGKAYRVLKTLHTLTPQWLRELADEFLEYFESHEHKVLHMYYDRAGNNYKGAKQDLASKLKKAIEFDGKGKRTGWKVVLMSLNQGNIPQHEEYTFMMELMPGRNKHLPQLLIDRYNCKPLKSSIEMAPPRFDKDDNIIKDKKSEKLPTHRLPFESTNFSDAFKYLMMRKLWRRAAKARKGSYTGA